MSEEDKEAKVQQEISDVFTRVLDICNGHSFAANKAALLLARDAIVREEIASMIKEQALKESNTSKASAVTNLTTSHSGPQATIIRANGTIE